MSGIIDDIFICEWEWKMLKLLVFKMRFFDVEGNG